MAHFMLFLAHPLSSPLLLRFVLSHMTYRVESSEMSSPFISTPSPSESQCSSEMLSELLLRTLSGPILTAALLLVYVSLGPLGVLICIKLYDRHPGLFWKYG